MSRGKNNGVPPAPPAPLVATADHVRTTSVPAEMRPTIDQLHAAWRWLVPTWVHNLTISLNTGLGAGITARVRPSYEYRMADLEVSARFLDSDQATREDAWIHEHVHMNLAPIQRWCETIIEDAEKRVDPMAVKILQETYTQALEASTQDLTRAIHARLHELGPTQP